MKKSLQLLCIALIGLFLSVACSQQNREADPVYTGEELQSYLDGMLDSGVISTLSTDAVDDISLFMSAPETLVYFAEGCEDCSYGSAQSVTALVDSEFLSPDGSSSDSFYPEEIRHSRVTFFDYLLDGAHQVGLLFDMWVQASGTEGFEVQKYFIQTTFAEIQTDDITGRKVMFVELQDTSNPANLIEAVTYDIDNQDELKPVVTFELYQYSGGERYYLGKISSLIGYE